MRRDGRSTFSEFFYGDISMTDFEEAFSRAKEFHGHVCPGIVLGTRLTLAGMRELGMDPRRKNHNLIVYMEIDRCGADAVQAITGCSLGHRNLKHKDYGKFAATFVNPATRQAVRVAVFEKNREKHDLLGKDEVIRVLSTVPEDEILKIDRVAVAVPDDDMPGFPHNKAICSMCGEQVVDSREILREGRVMCRNCANGSYYSIQG